MNIERYAQDIEEHRSAMKALGVDVPTEPSLEWEAQNIFHAADLEIFGPIGNRLRNHCTIETYSMYVDAQGYGISRRSNLCRYLAMAIYDTCFCIDREARFMRENENFLLYKERYPLTHVFTHLFGTDEPIPKFDEEDTWFLFKKARYTEISIKTAKRIQLAVLLDKDWGKLPLDWCKY